LLRYLLAAVLAAAASSLGCLPDVDDLDSEVYGVCYREQPVTITRVSPGLARGVLKITQIDLSKVDVLDDPHVGLRTVSVFAGDGVNDFSFVDSARLSVAETPLADLARETDVELAGDGDEDYNLFLLNVEDSLDIVVEIEGDIPNSTLDVTLDLCFSVDGVQISL
jgi:hypothetical protein